jgi:hypothetical protein
MKQIITIIVLLLPITAWAQIRLLPATEPLPLPRQGMCPIGYSWQGHYCTPISNNSAPAIPKPPSGTCPHGWTSSGSYCVRIL